ncbi:PREDICTED: cilia- and flagella-associated protein 53-like [Amphimedon queenslandica]|uniref:Cilia- and flagella-associated protein 53 n=1 Tax=Amphimedon queenslandica TaxID=400682 RepID=A0A1X7U302_AMPQE|nr:PREDICTED: cilia- and flagella-associated protein 53-like [Amphimedon queenslandica]|eukprot:XP_003389146.1 PREDICTED: cilia- and flagella-associated protein 53-like [Amphimedon queenslandica]
MDLGIIGGRRLNREVTGPTPHSVAIRAKRPSKLPKEHLILETRKQHKLREEAEAIVSYNKQFDLKTTWENETDAKLKRNTIKRRVEHLMQQRQYSLEERRDKLRALLQSEEEQYMSEIAVKQETTLERQAKMRERARQLREQREQQRLALVDEKLEQRWRNQCEEMRALLTRKHRDEVFTDRAYQLKLNAEKREREKQEEKMYAKMWQEDIDAKCKREEMEEAQKIERNRQMLKVLTLQTAAMEKNKEELRNLKEQEAAHLREEAALRVLEEHHAREEKKRSQEQRRAELNLSLRLKLKRKAREAQEELAMDMKLLEEMLKKSSDEATEHQERRQELCREMQQYRTYLAEQKKEEEKREKEVDQLLTIEVEKQWGQRLAQWKKEREARKKLLNDVVQTRQKQISEKLNAIAERKKELAKEAEEVAANIAKHKELEEQNQKTLRQKNKAHQQNLLDQMKYQEIIKKKEEQELQDDLELAQREEYLHQIRVRQAVLNPDLKKIHPRRLIELPGPP